MPCWDLLHHWRGLVIGDKLERVIARERPSDLREEPPVSANFAARWSNLPQDRSSRISRLLLRDPAFMVAFVGANPEVRFD